MKRPINILAAATLPLLSLCGCSATKEIPTELPPPSTREFFAPKPARLTGTITVTDSVNTFDGHLTIHSHNIITGEFATNTTWPSDTDGSFDLWLDTNTPSIYIIKANRLSPRNFYIKPGSHLDISADKTGRHTIYGGELGRINTELTEAPRSQFADSVALVTIADSIADTAKLLESYASATETWRDDIEQYIASHDLLPETRRILRAMPDMQHAHWLMNNQDQLGLDSPDDFTPLKKVLKMDLYALAQRAPGGLIHGIAYGSLLKRLGSSDYLGSTDNHTFHALQYFKRYKHLLRFLNIEHSEMPVVLQLAISQSLCSGGMLEKAGSYDEAINMLAAVSDSYITIPEIKQELEEYIRRLYKQPYPLPDNESTALLRRLLEPYQDKIIVLDFWNVLCGPCRRDIKETEEFRKKHRNNDRFAIVYITSESGSPADDYEDYVSRHMSDDNLLRLSDADYSKVALLFNVQLLPRQILLDSHGRVADDHFRISQIAARLHAMGIDL